MTDARDDLVERTRETLAAAKEEEEARAKAKAEQSPAKDRTWDDAHERPEGSDEGEKTPDT